MKKDYLAYAILAIVTIIIVAGWAVESKPFWDSSTAPAAQSGMRTIQLDGKVIRVGVADNDATRELGLGGHAPLTPDEGMLFVFQQDGVYGFWMKGMTFPLDIMWLSDDGTITYMQQNLPPETYPHAFGPGTPARYVLEVSAGYAQQNGVKVGDKVQL